MDDPRKRAEGILEASDGALPHVDLGVFIAYFPTWLKFHELFRLGAYTHPLEFISAQYENDWRASEEYSVSYHDWETEFSELKCCMTPFAYLSPAMQEGSALAGPFLPSSWSLSDIHHYMGLGSIWTIGLPILPSSVAGFGNPYSMYCLVAHPEEWQDELASPGMPLEPTLAKSFDTSFKINVDEDLVHQSWPNIFIWSHRTQARIEYSVLHVGAKLGTSSVQGNPGWTSHLPGKYDTICVKYVGHDLSGSLLAMNAAAKCMENLTGSASFADKLKSQIETNFIAPLGSQPLFGTPLTLNEEAEDDQLEWE